MRGITAPPVGHSTVQILTGGFAGASIRLQLVAVRAVAPEGAPLVVALLAAEARDQALVDVLAGLGVVEELVPRRAGALGPEGPLDAVAAAAAVVQCTVV